MPTLKKALRSAIARLSKKTKDDNLPHLTQLLAQLERVDLAATAPAVPPAGCGIITVISNTPRPPACQDRQDGPPPLENKPRTSEPSADGPTDSPPPAAPEGACQFCNSLMPQGAPFCPHCLKLVDADPPPPNFCPACGMKRPAGVKDRCPQCHEFFSEEARRDAVVAEGDARAGGQQPVVAGGHRLDAHAWRPVADGQSILEALEGPQQGLLD